MSIEVHVRTRPGVSAPVWSSAETVLYSTINPSTRYVYNKVYPSNSTNHNIFQNIEAIVHAAVDGKNVTIMAYGQTGSGKTHSMIGTNDDAGIIPRTARLLLELKRTTPGLALYAYYTEIYNESVRDLLEPQRGELALHDAPDGGVYFDKKVIEVTSFDDFLTLQALAERNRKYGVTNLNDHSSRSHIILTFELHRGTTSRPGVTLTSVINLVDLAGSESATRANTEGAALREGGFINRSLLALGNVVDAIVEKRAYVPYRDAKLTRVLRTCLGGLGITFILCCVNPSRANLEQTIATLRFTQRAMKIKNDPVMQLHMPPLFTHQYSRSVQQLIAGLDESCAAAYQNGLRDAFLYCGSTVSSVMNSFNAQLAQSMNGLATVQRLLLAHDHARAADQLGRLHGRLQEARHHTTNNTDLAECERKRARELDVELHHRRTKLAKLEADLTERTAIADTELAGWEYQLHELRQHQISPLKLLVQEEWADRARIEYEWVASAEGVVARAVPVLQRWLLRAVCASEPSHQPTSNDPDTASQSVRPDVTALQRQLRRARAELSDLQTAYDMIKDDLALDTVQPRSSTLPSHSPPPRVVDEAAPPNVTSNTNVDHAQETEEDELGRRVRRLEQEREQLLRRARRQVRLHSLQQVRESMGRQATHPTLLEHDVAASTRPRTRSRSTRAGTPPCATSSPAAPDSYAAGVRNALSVLDSLKQRLMRGENSNATSRRRPASTPRRATSALSSSSTPTPRRTPHESTSHNVHHTADVDEDLTLLELYQREWHRAAPSRPRSHRRPRAVSDDKENVRAGPGAASATRDVARLKSTTPVREGPLWESAPSRTGGARQSRAAVVERALWGLHANSQSPSRDRQSWPRPAS